MNNVQATVVTDDLDGIKSEAAARVPPLWRLVSCKGRVIIPFNELGRGPALYCVHPIAGDVTSFIELARSLGPEQSFYGIQVPRKKMTAALAASIETLARHHVETLIAFQPEGPLVLGGWSAGAIVALEMAQQLRLLGRDVPLLIALDGAPCNTGAGLRRWHPLYGWKLICNLPRWIRYEVQDNPSAPAFARQIVKKFIFRTRMKRHSLQDEQTLHGRAVQDLLESTRELNDQTIFIRTLYDAMRAYTPKSYAGRVIVYESKTQPLDHLLQVGATWRKIADLAEIVMLAGNHSNMFRQPGVIVLARDLRARLAQLKPTNDANTLIPTLLSTLENT